MSGVITQLWDVKAVGKVKILDKEEVVKELSGECEIKSIELVYFVPLPKDGRTYIYPAYAVYSNFGAITSFLTLSLFSNYRHP